MRIKEAAVRVTVSADACLELQAEAALNDPRNGLTWAQARVMVR